MVIEQEKRRRKTQVHWNHIVNDQLEGVPRFASRHQKSAVRTISQCLSPDGACWNPGPP
jgi:hypothetical protein